MNPVTQFPELPLGTPEATEAEHRFFEAFRVWPLQRAMIDEMCGGGTDRICAARQRLAGLWHGNFLEAEHAWFSCNRCPQYMSGTARPKCSRRPKTITSWPAPQRTAFTQASQLSVMAAHSLSMASSCDRARGKGCRKSRAGPSSVPPGS